jgi:2-oxoglutarate dehydrogenase E2 component (dihydrolipoamide succinyltransferase)
MSTGSGIDPDVERVPLSRLRRRIGDNMVRSLAISPHVTVSVDVDYGRLTALRADCGEMWRTRHSFSLTYLPFVARAVCEGLAAHPDLNASIDGNDLIRHRRVELGVAVDLARSGLVVPVVRDAGALDLTGLAIAIHALHNAAAERRLAPDDVAGGTFTITSPGRRGADRSTPIIHQPQVAILAIDAIRDRPVVAAGEIVVRPVGALSLSFDHRAVDGVYATEFLSELRDAIESESRGLDATDGN